MPSRAYTSFLRSKGITEFLDIGFGVNALSGLYLISTMIHVHMNVYQKSVSMPSRAYTSFLHDTQKY